jgi:nitrogen fixation/metabolism regulation signal transduction histidine kinase
MKSLFYRPIQLAALVFALLLLLALGLLGGLSLRDHQRLETIRQSIDYTHAIQGVGLTLQHILLEDVVGNSSVNREQLQQIGIEIDKIIQSGTALLASTPDNLIQVQRLLTGTQQSPKVSLAAVLELMRQTTHEEINTVSRLITKIDRNASTEFELAIAALIILPSLLALAIWLLRSRIFNPINNLKELLLRLTNGEFTPIPLKHVDPLLMPLLDNYNQMVTRLVELERAHRSHTASLEAEVRAATQTLLQQHYNLARAERLAAIGEVSAKLAHELRNPLAGIHFTLSNLQRDLRDPDFVARLDLVLIELERISRLLNDLLTQVRHTPEPVRSVQLAKVVKDLLALIRYQAPADIVLEAHVPDELQCRLPEGQLRQALLNLILNALQALEGRVGNITVRAEKCVDRLHLSVCDNGPGFPEPLLSQGGVRTFISGRASGTGLGLAMVRRFAQDLGGRLELSNPQSGGACAALKLPCEEGNG